MSRGRWRVDALFDMLHATVRVWSIAGLYSLVATCDARSINRFKNTSRTVRVG
jgi:hypothetical protein